MLSSFDLRVASCSVLAGAVLLGATLMAQKPPVLPLKAGDTLPRIEGQFLSGRQAVLPDAAQGRPAVILMGFTYGSRIAVEQWAEQVRPALASFGDATFFEVPVIGGMARMGKWFIDSGMRRGTPKELHENVITVWGGADRLKSSFGYVKSAEDDAYVTLVDGEGRILWMQHGPYSAEAFASLLDAARLARSQGK